MRKFLSALLVFSFTACGSGKNLQGSGEGSTEIPAQESTEKEEANFSQEQDASGDETAIQITIGDITYCEAHHNRTLITGFAKRFL